jgi:phosphoribosyl 1,2-cyclic phosphodiesterase
VWDSSYDDRNFQNYRGWGHSTWQEGLRFGQSARVRRVALSHHDPSRDDAAAALIRETLDPAQAFLAHDRMQVTLDTPDMDSAA